MTSHSPLIVPDSDELEPLDGSTLVMQPSRSHAYTGNIDKNDQQMESAHRVGGFDRTHMRRQAASRAGAHIARSFPIACTIVFCVALSSCSYSHFLPGGALDSQTTETQWVGTLGAQPRDDFQSKLSSLCRAILLQMA